MVEKEELIKYINLGKTCNYLSKIYEESPQAIIYWFKHYKIYKKYLTRMEGLRKLKDRKMKEILQKCIKLNLDGKQIAKVLKVRPSVISFWLKKYNLKTINVINFGNWQKQFDWSKINEDFQNNLSWHEISIKYKISMAILNKAREKKLFKRLSEEEMEKRWWGADKISFPERYFRDKLKNTNFLHNKQFDRYRLDFIDFKRKINFETDGMTHYKEKQIIHDNKRNQFMNDRGFVVIRLNWSQFLKSKENIRNQIIYYIINDYTKLINDNIIKILYPEKKIPTSI